MKWAISQLRERDVPYRKFLRAICLDLDTDFKNINLHLRSLGIFLDSNHLEELRRSILNKYKKFLKKDRKELFKKLDLYEYYLFETKGYEVFEAVLEIQRDKFLRLSIQSSILLQDPNFIIDVLAVPPRKEVLELYEKYFFDLKDMSFGDIVFYINTIPSIQESIILKAALSGERDQAISVLLGQIKKGEIRAINLKNSEDIVKTRTIAYLNLINEISKGSFADIRKIREYKNIFFDAIKAAQRDKSLKSDIKDIEDNIDINFADLDITKDERFIPLKKIESA